MVSKKDWYETQADPTQHKFANEIERLTEKYATKGKDFTKTEQYRGYKSYLDPDPITGAGGVPESRGGGLGAIRENDPVLSAGSEAAQLARENLLYQAGGKRRGNLTAEDIKGINIDLVKEGMTPDDYFRFNQMRYSPNIEEYQKARPVGSGKALGDLMTLASPLKYLAAGVTKAKDTVSDLPYIISNIPGDIMGSEMVEGITEDWKGRKKGGGIHGLIDDALNMVGIGNTNKTNKFITRKTDNNTIETQDSSNNTPLETDTEIKTNMMEIKDDKVKVIKLHELTDLKRKRDELFKKITQGNNEAGLYSEWEATVAKINDLEEGKLQDMKEGGIASLATGGLLEKERVQQSFSPLNSAMNYGIGGLSTLFGQGGPRGGWHPQHPIKPQIQDPWGIKPMGEQITGFGETLGGFGEQIGGFGEQLGGYEDVLGGYGQDISSFKETMGGFGNQFENINNKLTAVEEGIASLSDKIGTTQGNTQPQGRPNFGYGFNAYSPWMFGGFGRGRYG